MATKQTLTPAAIDTLRKGKLDDPLTPGLAIEVLSSGKKRWRYRRRMPASDVELTWVAEPGAAIGYNNRFAFDGSFWEQKRSY